MPSCKNCGSRITRFDKDICPVCGMKKPLQGVTSETVEITSDLKLNLEELKTFKPRTKFRAMLFFFGLGWTGAPQFYLYYPLQGVLWLLLNLIILGGFFALFFFLSQAGLILSIVLPIVIAYIFNFIFGIFVFFKHNLKDGKGEFLR